MYGVVITLIGWLIGYSYITAIWMAQIDLVCDGSAEAVELGLLGRFRRALNQSLF